MKIFVTKLKFHSRTCGAGRSSNTLNSVKFSKKFYLRDTRSIKQTVLHGSELFCAFHKFSQVLTLGQKLDEKPFRASSSDLLDAFGSE